MQQLLKFGTEQMNFTELECPVLKDMTIVAAPDQVSNDLDGETIILNMKTGQYYGVAAVEARIWDYLQSPVTVPEIKEKILSMYDVEPDRCKKDILGFLQDLADEGLIEVHDEPAG